MPSPRPPEKDPLPPMAQPVTGALAAWERFRLARPAKNGARVGRYRLGRVLGSGGMGIVFAAVDEELHRNVAVKLFRAGRVQSHTAMKLLRREARALAQLCDPRIVNVFDFGVLPAEADPGLPLGCVDSTAFIVMELVRGTALSRVKFESWAALRPIVLEVAEALARLHEAGATHGDIKPANILVEGKGAPKIVDFGLARLGASVRDLSTDADVDGSSTLDLRTEGIAGTPSYMAPELFAGGSPSAASDQYALCVAIFELIFGRRPFPQQNLRSLADAKWNADIDWSQPRYRVPSSVREALARGMNVEPDARFTSLRALAAALRPRPPRRLGGALLSAALSAAATAAAVVALAVPSAATGQAFTPSLQLAVQERAALATGTLSCEADVERVQTAYQQASAAELDRSAASLAVESAALSLSCGDDPRATLRWLRQADVHVAHADVSPALQFRIDVLRSRATEAPIADRIALLEARLDELDRAEDAGSAWAEVAAKLAYAYATVERAAEGQRLAERALAVMVAEHGPDDPKTAGVRAGLALVLSERGRLEQATRELSFAVQTLDATLGRTHRDTLRHRANLGSLLFRSGRALEGLEILESVLDPLRQTLGADHSVVLGFATNAALAHTRAGIQEGSLELMERGEAIIRRALIDDEVARWESDRRVAHRVHVLGVNLYAQGRLREAAAALTTAIEGLGVHADDAAFRDDARHDLARVHLIAGTPHKAIALMLPLLSSDAADLREAVGIDLAYAYLDAGMAERARSLVDAIPDDERQAPMKRTLAAGLAAARGDVQEADRLYRAAVDAARDDGPPIELADALAAAAPVARAAGHRQRATQWGREALRVCRRVQAPEAEACEVMADRVTGTAAQRREPSRAR